MSECKHEETHMGYDGRNFDGAMICYPATVCDECSEVLDSYWMKWEREEGRTFGCTSEDVIQKSLV